MTIQPLVVKILNGCGKFHAMAAVPLSQ